MFSIYKKIFLNISILFLVFFLKINFVLANEINDIDINVSLQAINSYVPPFYEGRALTGEEGQMRIVVDISKQSDLKKIYFDWVYNDFVVYQNSGFGKNTFVFGLDILKTTNILELKLYKDKDLKQFLGGKKIEISPRPFILGLYRKDDFLYNYTNALNKKNTIHKVKKNEDIEIVAEPYFFNTNSPIDESLYYSWKINKIVSKNYNRILKHTFPDYTNTNYPISLSVENDKKILESNDTTLNFIVN